MERLDDGRNIGLGSGFMYNGNGGNTFVVVVIPLLPSREDEEANVSKGDALLLLYWVEEVVFLSPRDDREGL